MNTKQPEHKSIHLSQENLLAIVRTIIGGSQGYPNDQEPIPPGPWDPVIRTALRFLGPHPESSRSIETIFNPLPQPWKVIFERNPELWDLIGPILGEKVGLNPQPLPPRFTFVISLAQTVINRAEMLQDIAGAIQQEGEKQGIIVVGGYISRFVKDICGNDFKLKWPFPWPPPYWFMKEVSGIDLVILATQFEKAGAETYNPELRQSLANASAKLVEAGVAKMQ